MGDVNREYYRSKQEEQIWKTERDPITLFQQLVDRPEEPADRARLDQINAEVKAEMEKAVQFAMASPYPDVDKVDQDVYA